MKSFLKEKYVQTKVGKIYYIHDNSFVNKPTVVFLHGLSSNHTTWLKIIDEAHRLGYNSLAVDLRGHGLSDKSKKKSLYKSVFIEDVHQIVCIEKLDKFTLVGYSYSGPVAIDYALKHPEKLDALVLISANYVSPPIYKRLRVLDPICYTFLQLAGILLLWQKKKKYYYYQHGQAKNFIQSVWIGLNTMPLAINAWMLSEMFQINFRKPNNSISNIQIPTLLVRAPNDIFLTRRETEEMAKMMPNAQLITTQHNSHFVASRSQEEIAGIIMKFLKENYQ